MNVVFTHSDDFTLSLAGVRTVQLHGLQGGGYDT